MDKWMDGWMDGRMDEEEIVPLSKNHYEKV